MQRIHASRAGRSGRCFANPAAPRRGRNAVFVWAAAAAMTKRGDNAGAATAARIRPDLCPAGAGRSAASAFSSFLSGAMRFGGRMRGAKEGGNNTGHQGRVKSAGASGVSAGSRCPEPCAGADRPTGAPGAVHAECCRSDRCRLSCPYRATRRSGCVFPGRRPRPAIMAVSLPVWRCRNLAPASVAGALPGLQA